jgi:molybdate transport system substrate-binding protein
LYFPSRFLAGARKLEGIRSFDACFILTFTTARGAAAFTDVEGSQMDIERPMAITAAKGMGRLNMIVSRGSARIHHALVEWDGRRFTTSALLAAALSLPLFFGHAAKADDVVILSAAAVRPALIQLPAMVETAAKHRVVLSFGNAAAIHTMVVDGKRADIVILPPRQLTALIGHGHLSADGRADLGIVRLGVAVRAGGKAPPVRTADEFRKAMLAAVSFGMPDPADGSTSSQHMVKILNELGIADAMKPKIRHFKDGTQALNALANGEIALTIAPMTSIRVVDGIALAGPLPEALQSLTVYAAALSQKSATSAPVKAVMGVLTSPTFAAVLREKGIDPP